MQQGRVDRRIAIALHAGLLIGGLVSGAAAQPAEPTRASLRVRNAVDCLESSAIERQVRARSQRIAFVAETPDVPRLVVQAQHRTGRALAVELKVAWPDGRQSRRELAADGCEDATSAIAFLIALTLDPQSATQSPAGGVANSAAGSSQGEGAAASDTVAGSGAAATAASNGAAGNAATPAAAPLENAQAKQAAVPEAATPNEPDDSEGAFLEFDYAGFGAGGTLIGGVSPNLMPGLAVHAIVAFRSTGLLAPAVQLTAAQAWVSGLSQPGGVADFQRTTVRLDACPVALDLRFVTARPCVSAAAGSLNAQGSDTYVPRTSTRGWLDLGTSLRLNADLGPVFQIVAGLTLAFPLRRDAFAFRPDVFHRVPALSWEGQLGLGLRFP